MEAMKRWHTGVLVVARRFSESGNRFDWRECCSDHVFVTTSQAKRNRHVRGRKEYEQRIMCLICRTECEVNIKWLQHKANEQDIEVALREISEIVVSLEEAKSSCEDWLNHLRSRKVSGKVRS